MGRNCHHKHGYVQRRPGRCHGPPLAPTRCTACCNSRKGPTCLRCDLVRLQRRTGAISVRCGVAQFGVGGVCIASMKDTCEQQSSHSCDGECSARTHGVLVCTRTGASMKGA